MRNNPLLTEVSQGRSTHFRQRLSELHAAKAKREMMKKQSSINIIIGQDSIYSDAPTHPTKSPLP
jgi:hypothetical protein